MGTILALLGVIAILVGVWLSFHLPGALIAFGIILIIVGLGLDGIAQRRKLGRRG